MESRLPGGWRRRCVERCWRVLERGGVRSVRKGTQKRTSPVSRRRAACGRGRSECRPEGMTPFLLWSSRRLPSAVPSLAPATKVRQERKGQTPQPRSRRRTPSTVAAPHASKSLRINVSASTVTALLSSLGGCRLQKRASKRFTKSSEEVLAAAMGSLGGAGQNEPLDRWRHGVLEREVCGEVIEMSYVFLLFFWKSYVQMTSRQKKIKPPPL